ncbi:MAG: hypothetical protein ACR2HV_08090 [Acidimicrobiales bacterium]
MGCLIVLAALLSPRFVVVLLYLFTERLTIAFESGWVGLAGFVFLPWTTALYALAYHPVSGVSELGWVIVGIGFVVDLASLFGGGRHAKKRRD